MKDELVQDDKCIFPVVYKERKNCSGVANKLMLEKGSLTALKKGFKRTDNCYSSKCGHGMGGQEGDVCACGRPISMCPFLYYMPQGKTQEGLER